jgi:hypothetical protein
MAKECVSNVGQLEGFQSKAVGGKIPSMRILCFCSTRLGM